MLVLLDRDGVLNRDMKTGILRLEDFEILPRIPESIARLSKAGFKVAICTNQSAVGRGRLSVETLDALHAILKDAVQKAGGHIDAIYYAPDAPENPTDRRKPGPGMLREALAEFGADAARTPFVGDALRDLQAAHAAGCPSILVRSGHGAETERAGLPAEIRPAAICNALPDAVDYILQHYAGA